MCVCARWCRFDWLNNDRRQKTRTPHYANGFDGFFPFFFSFARRSQSHSNNVKCYYSYRFIENDSLYCFGRWFARALARSVKHAYGQTVVLHIYCVFICFYLAVIFGCGVLVWTPLVWSPLSLECYWFCFSRSVILFEHFSDHCRLYLLHRLCLVY